MLGEIIRNILMPTKTDEWVIIETYYNFYSLRLGGFKKAILKSTDLLSYKSVKEINYFDTKIVKIYGDDEWCYIILENDFVIATGCIDINQNGEISIGIYLKHLNNYESNYFKEDLQELKFDKDGNSYNLPH